MLYIYICYWVHLRPPETALMRSFAAPQAFICGPPFLKPLFFCSAKWGFCCFRKSSFFAVFEVVFCRPEKFSFFARVSGLGSSRRSPRGTRTRSTWKQGVSEQFSVVVPRSLALDSLYRLDAAQIFLRIIFGGLTNLFFSEVRILTKLGLEGKKRLGAAELRTFWKWHFSHFSRAGTNLWNFWRVFGAQLCRGLGSSRAVARNLFAAAVRMVFPSFPGLFFRHRFANLKRDLLKIPSLLFVFCSFLRFLLEFGSTQPCMCVLGQLAIIFFFFLFLFVCLQKHCFFPMKKGLFLFISLCLPFLSPWLHSLLIFTLCLSLSLSLSLVFFCCPSLFLFIFVIFLVFLLFMFALFLCFCFMTTTTSKY